jgi:hypothetical protein
MGITGAENTVKASMRALSRRDNLRIARRFNAGVKFVIAQVPKGRLRFPASAVPAGLYGLSSVPGDKSPGYYQMFLRNNPEPKAPVIIQLAVKLILPNPTRLPLPHSMIANRPGVGQN